MTFSISSISRPFAALTMAAVMGISLIGISSQAEAGECRLPTRVQMAYVDGVASNIAPVKIYAVNAAFCVSEDGSKILVGTDQDYTTSFKKVLLDTLQAKANDGLLPAGLPIVDHQSDEQLAPHLVGAPLQLISTVKTAATPAQTAALVRKSTLRQMWAKALSHHTTRLAAKSEKTRHSIIAKASTRRTTQVAFAPTKPHMHVAGLRTLHDKLYEGKAVGGHIAARATATQGKIAGAMKTQKIATNVKITYSYGYGYRPS